MPASIKIFEENVTKGPLGSLMDFNWACAVERANASDFANMVRTGTLFSNDLWFLFLVFIRDSPSVACCFMADRWKI